MACPLWEFLSINGTCTILLANSGDPDQMPHSAVSDLDLFCLHIPHKKDARPIWVNQVCAWFIVACELFLERFCLLYTPTHYPQHVLNVQVLYKFDLKILT